MTTATPTEQFEKRALALSEARAQLVHNVTELQSGIEAIKKQYLKQIRLCVQKVAEKHDQLKAIIEQHPESFVKPRTLVMHGIKFGLGKGKGAMTWEDDEKVIKAIKRLCAEQADILITTVEKPSKEAIAQLPADIIKKLGITVEKAGDQVVIKATDKDVDKLVNALLKGATEEEE